MLPRRQSRWRRLFVVDLNDIDVHEYGHGFSKERGINAIEISKEAYYYIYKVTDMKFNQGTLRFCP